MKTRSARRGPSTLDVEVTNVSTHGFWLLIADTERFVRFRTFPWFSKASITALTKVTLPSPHHLYWPALDVDLAVDSIDHPERYPLVSQERDTGAKRATASVRESTKRYTSRRRRRS